MEQNNYLSLVKILGNVTKESDKTSLDNLKFLFKTFIFGDKDILNLNELWFEKEEIKVDKEYYQLIQSLITVFVKYFSDETSFKEDLLSKEIFSLFKNTKYFCLYNNLTELCYTLELGEEYYTEISCALYILGIKKGTPINAILIQILEDFAEDESVENSKFCTQIKSIKYETINDSFMNNLTLLYNLIKSNGDEEEIKQKLMNLENPEDQSSVSTNVENIEIEDKKLIEEKKNSQNISPIKDEQNLNAENNGKKNIDSQGDNSLIKKEKELLHENRSEMDKDKEEIKYKDINDTFDIKKTINFADEIVEKTEAVDKDVKNNKNLLDNESRNETQNNDINKNTIIEKKDDVFVEKNQNNESEKISIHAGNTDGKKEANLIESAKSLDNENIIIQEKEDIISGNDIQNNGIKQIYSNYSLEELLNYIKNKSEELKKEEKEIKTDSDNIIEKCEKKILNLVTTYFQIQNRFYLIVQQLEISKNTIKEIEVSQFSQKIIAENKIEIEKFITEINLMKSVIELLKTPSFVIVKRKLLDMIIFSLIKTNKDKFEIDKNYCPGEFFLNKILKKIEKYSENILRKDDVEKINESKKKINELINKNQSTITFPLSCTDEYLDIIIGYLSFCKGKYNQVVHISEEAVKYFLYLSFYDRTEPKFKEFLNLFKKEEKNKDKNFGKKNITKLNSKNMIEEEDGKDESEINYQYSRPLKINAEIALEFFLKDNFGIDDDDSKLKKKLEILESKKNS